MSHEITSLVDRKQFWKSLFEEKKLAPQIATLVTDGEHVYDISEYGKVHVKVVSGSSLGDHFQSDSFIVTAQFMHRDGEDTPKTLSTFVKVLPSIKALRDKIREPCIHQREINIYRHFFDYLREIRANHLIPLDVPDVYYANYEEPADKNGSETCNLLEDLKAERYCMVDKMKGMDYEHCKMALTSLAHYHALTMSAVRKWKDPTTGELSRIPPTFKFLFNDTTQYDKEILEGLTEFSSGPIVTFLEDIEGEKRYLLEWVKKFTTQTQMSKVNIVETLESSGLLVCIVHGDYWNNNMLFKYEDGIPVSLRMLDFQLSRVGHPLGDVTYFLYTSTLPKTRQDHLGDLLSHYFDTLTSDLRLLGIFINNYNIDNFRADFKESSVKWMFRSIMAVSLSQNKQVVTDLKEADAKQLNQPKLEDQSTQEMMKKVPLLSDNFSLSERILNLIEEVWCLNNSQ